MLQYLVNDHLPGFNLPKLCTTIGGVYLNSLKSEIRRCGDDTLLITRPGIIALTQDSGRWLWVLYNDLTVGLMSSSSRQSLPYTEAVKMCLLA